ncbi:MAG: DUF11 domain-containing protein [Chloroflexi bacterium]|nr:DUF11 domain-containing protein [Chloroflexota bacterium]
MIGMIRRILRREDGVTIVMVLAFMALSVPVVTAALGLASTLNIDSRVKGDIAQAQFSAIGANELAIQRLTEDNLPAPDGNGIPDILEEDNNGFDDGDGIPDIWEDVDGDGNPDGYHETIDIDGDPVDIDITPELPAPLQPPSGEGLVVTKNIFDQSRNPIPAYDSPTDWVHYEIIVENQGTDPVTLLRVYDGLPPGFTYKGSSKINGTPITKPEVLNDDLAPLEALLFFDEGDQGLGGREMLAWHILDDLELVINPGEQIVLTFKAKFQNMPDGYYCNYAWTEPEGSQTQTGMTAPLVIGSPATTECVGVGVTVETSAVAIENPNQLPLNPNDDIEITYTIVVSNNTPADVNLWWLRNKLPPGFTYVWNSATGSLTSSNPLPLTYAGRQRLNWFFTSPIIMIPSGTQKEISFKALSPRAAGLYRSEVWAFFSEFVGHDDVAPYSWPDALVFLADRYDVKIDGKPTSQVWVVDNTAYVRRWEISR